MSLQVDIGGIAGNDLVYSFQLLKNGKPLSLSDYTPKVVVKASKTATDGSGTAYAAGTGLTVVSAALGMLTLTIPAADTAVAGTTWYRCDVTANSQDFTVCFGNLVFLAA